MENEYVISIRCNKMKNKSTELEIENPKGYIVWLLDESKTKKKVIYLNIQIYKSSQIKKRLNASLIILLYLCLTIDKSILI